jgi:hypothetical protein
MEESFATKFPPEQIEKILDPKGFLQESEYKEYEGLDQLS